ncbi:beta-ketoacyl-ACP synthase III [Amycolatopsis thermoflava]
MTAVLAGLGTCLPPRVVGNRELSQRLDTSDDWIQARTGIHERRIADTGTTTVGMATSAADAALSDSGMADVDALVLATSTPDQLCPGSAPQVAAGLGLSGIPALDVNAACTGFLYALAAASGMLAAELAERVLVIGADTFSRLCDPDDRTTAPIFGDGAGAVVLRAGTAAEPGALGPFDLHADGTRANLLVVPAGGSKQRFSDNSHDYFLHMQGREVFRHACAKMAESVLAVLRVARLPLAGVDRLVGHQANLRILQTLAARLGLDEKHLVTNIGHVGNTSAASIPLALADAVDGGHLRPGHHVVLTAFGAGLTWGSSVLTWPPVRGNMQGHRIPEDSYEPVVR